MAEPSAVLVQRAQAGDRDALSALVQSQQTYVYSIAMSLMHNPADAADMTQEAFIRLLRSLGTYRGETKLPLSLDANLDGIVDFAGIGESRRSRRRRRTT